MSYNQQYLVAAQMGHQQIQVQQQQVEIGKNLCTFTKFSHKNPGKNFVPNLCNNKKFREIRIKENSLLIIILLFPS